MSAISALPQLLRGAAAGSSSLLLRLASLVSKLALSLFMGRFFSLSELGMYGLAFGAVMLAIVVFGFRVDYVVSREIQGMDQAKRRRVGTEVALLYCASFLVVAPLALPAMAIFGLGDDIALLLLIYALCGVEAYANFIYTVTIALRRPALANALFFIRSGLWTLPVMAVSYFDPTYRTVEFVLAGWLSGATASVLLNLWVMRGELLGPVTPTSFRWGEVGGYCRSALFIWIGSLAVTLGAYLDRFVLASFLTLRDVGVATFYTSFTAAVLTLVQSATTSVTFPTMIEHYDARRIQAFHRELNRTALIAACASLVILAGLAGIMPFMGEAMGKPELVVAYPAFLLLLLATLVRTHSETLYFGLFVKRQHRAIWTGNLAFFGASLLGNLLLIPPLGLNGLGLAAIFAALVILAWRWVALKRQPA